MCMKSSAPPAPKAPPPPPTQLDAKVDSTRNRQARAGLQGKIGDAMTGAGAAPQTAGASPVLGV